MILTFNGKFMSRGLNKVLGYNDPYNPLELPLNTVRVRTSDGNPPTMEPDSYTSPTFESATLVPGTTDIYDVYKSGTNFNNLLYSCSNVVEVLGANTANVKQMFAMFTACTSLISVPLFNTSNVTNMESMFSVTPLTSIPLFDTSSVTNMSYMFHQCRNLTTVPLFDTSKVTTTAFMFRRCLELTSVPLFDTSSVTDMDSMFWGCGHLTTVPLFNTSNVTYIHSMFRDCTNIQSGALALYQQASSQAIPPAYHDGTFRACGRDTTTGAAELAQIPSDWK